MQSSLKLFALIAIMSLAAEGALYFEKNTKDKYRPGMCYSTVFKIAIKIGKTHPLPDCGEMTCDKNYIISYAGCGVIQGPADCTKSEEYRSRPYPDCCLSSYCAEQMSENQEEGILII